MQNFNIDRIDAHTLRVFLKVIETGSVTKAAEFFEINQSTASHSLEKLRFAIGDTLFVRSGRGLVPTSAALAVAPRASDIVSRIESLVYSDLFNPNEDKRTITIAANVTEFCLELSELIRQLKTAIPKAPLRLIELGSRGNLENLLNNEIADIAISVQAEDNPVTLGRHVLTSDPLRIFYDAKFRTPIKTIEEYFEAEHASLDFGGAKKSTVTKIVSKMQGTRNMAIGVANVYALSSIIQGSRYIATMQERLKHSVFSELNHVDCPFECKPVKFELVWHKRHELDSRNILLRELAISVFTEFNKEYFG